MSRPNSFTNPFVNSQAPQIDLARSPFESPFYVDMEAFFEFSFWMTEELLDLEAKHKLKAKLKAQRRSVANRVGRLVV